MMSDLKLRTNRLNALSSTGPRTVEGKAISRTNALKHGLASADVVVKAGPYGESQEEYAALLCALQADLQPQGALESALVEQVAACLWRLRRVLRVEQGAIAERLTALRLDEAAQRATPQPDSRPLRTARAAELLRSSDGIRHLLQVLDDVRTGVRQHGLLSGEDKNKLFDSFGVTRRGVALTCAAHAAMAEEAADESKPHLRSASWHIEQIITALDGETARLQGLLPEVEQLEREAQIAEQAQAMVPSEAMVGKLARYEAHLDRRLHRALDQLERLQRQRRGDMVPAPVKLDLTVT
jgi:hypothetical protein